jgi:hypothetical protein
MEEMAEDELGPWSDDEDWDEWEANGIRLKEEDDRNEAAKEAEKKRQEEILLKRKLDRFQRRVLRHKEREHELRTEIKTLDQKVKKEVLQWKEQKKGDLIPWEIKLGELIQRMAEKEREADIPYCTKNRGEKINKVQAEMEVLQKEYRGSEEIMGNIKARHAKEDQVRGESSDRHRLDQLWEELREHTSKRVEMDEDDTLWEDEN